jgi:hypothetical protein
MPPADLDSDGAGGAAPFEVCCEQVIAGGGWTLIARSQAGASGDMGWGVNRGVTMGVAPYSLDAVAAGLTIDKLLVVSRKGRVQAYTIDLPANFVANYSQSAWKCNSNVAYVMGGCSPPGGIPSMLQYAGYTDRKDAYFLRDMGKKDIIFGLFAHGFSLNKMDCNKGGGLHQNRENSTFAEYACRRSGSAADRNPYRRTLYLHPAHDCA